MTFILSEAKDLFAGSESRCLPRDPSPAAQDDSIFAPTRVALRQD
jgi:hypothetical protein